MSTRQVVAVGLVLAVTIGTMPAAVAQQGTGVLGGTARKEAKKPFTDYSARARNVEQGQIADTVKLDASGDFSMTGLTAADYLVELLDRNGRVVCTEGPFNLSQLPALSKKDVDVDCGNPKAWWLLAAAAGAGITAGTVVAGPDSGSPASPAAATFAASPASAAQ